MSNQVIAPKRRLPGNKPFIGRWRITTMVEWDEEAMDCDVPAFIEFDDEGMGRFQFVVVQGHMDCRFSETEGKPRAEFTWAGSDEGDDVCGRGWARIDVDGRMTGEFFIHCGMDSAFTAVRLTVDRSGASTSRTRRVRR